MISMAKRRIGQALIYNSDENYFNLGEIPIYELEEFLGLQMRWIDTNTIASYGEKEVEWERLIALVKTNCMYEWKQEYVDEFFLKTGKMYLPARYYNRLLRGMS